jgi:hypothetical protein
VPIPARQIIYMTPIPPDCEQVAVLFDGWQAYPPDAGMQVCSTFRWTARLMVMITRKSCAVPTQEGRLPAPELMTRAAEVSAIDAELMLGVVAALDELDATVTVETPSVDGGLQSVVLSLVVPAFGGIS